MKQELLEVYRELWVALERRLAIVADRALYESDPVMHLEQLQEASAALEAAAQRLPATADPKLKHYMERQSLLKAKEWLLETLDSAKRKRGE